MTKRKQSRPTYREAHGPTDRSRRGTPNAPARGDSGLLLMATEQSRVLSYYVPALGPAPRWCSFLDVLTEELEEEQEASVYEDYKFVTTAEVREEEKIYIFPSQPGPSHPSRWRPSPPCDCGLTQSNDVVVGGCGCGCCAPCRRWMKNT